MDTSTQDNKQRNASLQRWLELSAGVAFASGILIAIAPLLGEWMNLPAIPEWSLGQRLFLFSAAVSWIATRVGVRLRGMFRGASTERFWLYPPTWAGIILCALAVAAGFLSDNSANGIREALFTTDREGGSLARGLGASLWPAITAFLYLQLIWPRSDLYRSSNPEAPRPRLDLNDPDQFRRWIESDEPLTSADDDQCGLRDIADRLAVRVSSNADSTGLSTFLQGPPGAGKSTVAAFVEERLSRTRPEVLCCRVSLWPYESPQAAVRGLLRRAIERMSTEVDVTALTGVPDRYAASIERASGGFGFIGRAIAEEQDPAVLINQIDRVLEARGLRLVLWIEDLDRLNDAEGAQAPLRAVLHILDQCGSIVVVVACANLVTLAEHKLARYTEVMPRLTQQFVGAQLERTLHQMIERHQPPLLEACDGARRRRFAAVWSLTSPVEPANEAARPFFWMEYHPGVFPDIPSAVAVLSGSLRGLKRLLRDILDRWQLVGGELDATDFIALSVLRSESPRLYEQARDWIPGLRDGDRPGDEKEGRRSKARRRLESALEMEKDPIRAKALRTLLLYLCPDQLVENAADSRDDERLRPPPQAVSLSTEMWDRMELLRPRPAELSDQAILTAVSRWKSTGDAESLVNFVLSSSSAEVAVRFAAATNPRDCAALATMAVMRASQRTDLPTRCVYGELSSWRRQWLLMVNRLLEVSAVSDRPQRVKELIAHLATFDPDLLVDVGDCWISQGALSPRLPEVADAMVELSMGLARRIRERNWDSEADLDQVVLLVRRVHEKWITGEARAELAASIGRSVIELAKTHSDAARLIGPKLVTKSTFDPDRGRIEVEDPWLRALYFPEENGGAMLEGEPERPSDAGPS